MADLFTRQVIKASNEGVVLGNTKKAFSWLQGNYNSISKSDVRYAKVAEATEAHDKITIGRLYQFKYDAKTKDKLPYWDSFPIVFPFAPAKGGFYGLNLHYLPLRERALLMDRLYDYVNNDKMDFTTKIRLSYNLLSKTANLKYFRPCVKRYLYKQMRSRFLYVDPQDWLVALFLPTEQFHGATKQKVWKDSKSVW